MGEIVTQPPVGPGYPGSPPPYGPVDPVSGPGGPQYPPVSGPGGPQYPPVSGPGGYGDPYQQQQQQYGQPGYGQQPQYGQQPAYGQQPGYPPQQGYPPQYGQQPYQQGGFQQPGQYPGFVPPAPKKSNTALSATLVIVGVLLLGGIGTTVAIFAFKSDAAGGSNKALPVSSGTPKEIVDKCLTSAFTNNDASGALKMVCASQQSNFQTKLTQAKTTAGASGKVTWKDLEEKVQTDAAAVSADITFTGTSGTGKPVALWFFGLAKQSGGWTLCSWIG